MQSPVRRLVVENFYTWKERLDFVFPLSGKAIVVGENGTGKSNLVRVVELMASRFPAPIEWEKEQLWDDTKRAEICLELTIPKKVRDDLLRATSLEMLRAIQPDVMAKVGGRDQAADIYWRIHKLLDEGGIFQTITMSYFTLPEWRGNLHAFCQTTWRDKVVVLLSHGGRTGYRIAKNDWRTEGLTYLRLEDGDSDEFLEILIAKEALQKDETPQFRRLNRGGHWELDHLSSIPKLVSEVKLYRRWLQLVEVQSGPEDGEDRYLEDGDVQNNPSSSVFASKIEDQRFVIQHLYSTLSQVQCCADIKLVHSLAHNATAKGRFLNDNMRAIEQMSFARVSRRLLRESVSILREDRGLLLDDDSSVTVLTLASIEDVLFAAKNSDSSQKRKQFQHVQEMLKTLLGLSIDVILEREWFEDRESEEDGGSWEEHRRIVFSKQGSERQFKLSEAFGGAYEVTLIAATLFVSEAQFVLLDEPGRNLHSSLRKDLLDVIYQQTDKSVLIISHDAEMLSAKRLSDVFYCKFLDSEMGSNLVPLAGLASDQKMRNFMACPDFRETFFSQGVIFVEGMADMRFLEALSVWFETTDVIPYIPNMLWLRNVRRLRRAVIPLRGVSESRRAIKIARELGIHWLLLCDFDGVLPKNPVEKVAKWGARKNAVVVKILLKDMQLKGTLLDVDVPPNSWTPLLNLIQEHNIFSWECDLEATLAVTAPNWTKENWSNCPFDEVLDFVGRLIREQNPGVLAFLQFLHAKGAFCELDLLR